MSARMMFEDFPWRVEVDWPKAGPNRIDYVMAHVSARAIEIADWLTEQFGENSWIESGNSGEGIIDRSAYLYAVRLRDQQAATLTVMRWS